jgi:hypothetical protein
VSFIIDGKLYDGGDERQFGWSRFSPNLLNVNGSKRLRVGEAIQSLRIYNRALMTCEAFVMS